MHVTSRKVITIGTAGMILCLGLPFVSQAGSSYDSTDYRNRYDTQQRGWGDSRSGKNDVPIDDRNFNDRFSHDRNSNDRFSHDRNSNDRYSNDRNSNDRNYYTDQYGDGDTTRTQENLKRNRSAANRSDDGYRNERAGAEMSDRDLANAVRRELSWSPFVDEDPIRVNAQQGVVTLQGTVEDKSEMAAAVDNAYEAGARRVNNQLRIQN